MTDSPRDIFQRLLDTSIRGAWPEFLDLYAEDAVIEMPFAPEGVPHRSDAAALRARITAMAASRPWTYQRAESVVVHETADPEVIVTEYQLHGTITATGEPLATSFVMVITVRDGKIVHSRDYANPLETAKLLRSRPELSDRAAS